MRVILQVITGPAEGRQIPLQTGEQARFGSNEVADVCFPDDGQMSDVHFEIDCRASDCLVRDLRGSGGTFLNDEPVEEAVINDGDQIAAGQTRLQASIAGQGGENQPVPEQEDQPEPTVAKLTAVELCNMTELEEEALQLFRPDHSPEAFIRVLIEHKQFRDAIAILTLYLPKEVTIDWARQAVDQVFPRDLISEERHALDIAQAWLDDPSEANQRAAMELAESLNYETAASLVAAAAGWSGGSIAPADLDEVPPDPRLTAQVAAGALNMVATEGAVASIDDRYEKIIQMGQQRLEQFEQ